MKTIIVGIFDRKAQAFISMEPTQNIAVVSRQFTEVVNKDTNSPMHKWPADFELYELGTFDNETGKVDHLVDEQGTPTKRLILNAEDVKATD